MDKLQLTLSAESIRLAEYSVPWAAARGPVDVFLLSLERLGWKAQNARYLKAGSLMIDLWAVPPATVKRLAYAAAADQLWLKLGQQDEFAGLGRPCLRPLRSILRRDSSAAGKRLSACLRSVLIGSQWPQERLYRHGLVETPECQLCKLTAGALRHRCWECPATAAWRYDHLGQLQLPNLANIQGVSPLFLERGLAPDLRYLWPLHCPKR